MFPLVSTLARSLIWRGALGVLIGVLALWFPLSAIGGIVLLFAIYALADAGMALAHAFTGDTGTSRWPYVLEAITGVALGIIALLRPGAATALLLTLLAVWSLVIGVFRLMAAVRLRKVITGEWLLVLSGVLAIIVGLWLLAAPTVVGAYAVGTVIGAYALVFGGLALMQGLRLQMAVRRHKGNASATNA